MNPRRFAVAVVAVAVAAVDVVASGVHKRGLVKGGLAIYVFPLCNFNTLCSVQICQIAKPPLLNPLL